MIEISKQQEEVSVSDYQHTNSEFISSKREKFREKIRNQDLNRIFKKNRDYQKQSPQYQQLCTIHQNSEECKFHDIYTTIKIFTYGYIDDFTLKRQVDYLVLQKRTNRQKYSHFELIARLSKLKIIIQNGKYTYQYGGSCKQSIFLKLIQKNGLFALDSQYVIKKGQQNDYNQTPNEQSPALKQNSDIPANKMEEDPLNIRLELKNQQKKMSQEPIIKDCQFPQQEKKKITQYFKQINSSSRLNKRIVKHE